MTPHPPRPVNADYARAFREHCFDLMVDQGTFVGLIETGGLDDPTATPLVRLEKKAARKILGVRQRQARAIRFKSDVSDFDSLATGVCLAHLLKACRRDLLGMRDAALLRVAYGSACRRSELVAIDVAHVDGPDGQGAGALFLPHSKTDQEGEGA